MYQHGNHKLLPLGVSQMFAQAQQVSGNLLSIVIVTRNEARNVARCIESALAVAARLPRGVGPIGGELHLIAKSTG